ncbi:MAG: helix-turn-helix transcriptional regulator [Pseudobdellovibrio sp.]
MNIKNYLSIDSLEDKFGPMSVCLFIKSFREADGVSQSDFAKKLKISRANLCDIEKGRKLIGAKRAAKLAKILKVPETTLLKLALQDTLRQANLNYQINLTKAS